MQPPDQGSIGALKSLQNLAVIGIGTEDGGSIAARLEHLVVIFLTFDVLAGIIGAKSAAVGSRPPGNRTAEELFPIYFQQCVGSTRAVFLFPLPVEYRVRGRKQHVVRNVAKAESQDQGVLGCFLGSNLAIFRTNGQPSPFDFERLYLQIADLKSLAHGHL